MRRKLPAIFGLDDPPNLGPFYRSDRESALHLSAFFGEFVVEREPELGGGREDGDQSEKGEDEIVEEEESGERGDGGGQENNEAFMGGVGIEADRPDEFASVGVLKC